MEFYLGTLIFSNSLLVISCLSGLIKWPLLSTKSRMFYSYIVFIFAIELFVKMFIFIFETSDVHFLYPFYVSGEFFLLMCLFRVELHMSKYMYIGIGLATWLIFIDTFYISNFDNHTQHFGKIVSHIAIIGLSAYILIKRMFDFERKNLFLLVYASLFKYYAVSLFFFLVLNQLATLSKSSASILWGMNNILASILYGTSIYIFLSSKRLR